MSTPDLATLQSLLVRFEPNFLNGLMCSQEDVRNVVRTATSVRQHGAGYTLAFSGVTTDGTAATVYGVVDALGRLEIGGMTEP